jgi:hypothetical protein
MHGRQNSSSGVLSLLVCSKSFQDELRITFTHGDAITITGAKVEQEESEVILVRELVKEQGTIPFFDDEWQSGTGFANRK